jgi:prolyl-tRNA synthetase
MRVSQLLTTTLREVPRDSEGVSQELLVRAGFVRQWLYLATTEPYERKADNDRNRY